MPNSHLMLACQTAFNFTKFKMKHLNQQIHCVVCLIHSGHTNTGIGTHIYTSHTHSLQGGHEKTEDHLS